MSRSPGVRWTTHTLNQTHTHTLRHTHTHTHTHTHIVREFLAHTKNTTVKKLQRCRGWPPFNHPTHPRPETYSFSGTSHWKAWSVILRITCFLQQRCWVKIWLTTGSSPTFPRFCTPATLFIVHSKVIISLNTIPIRRYKRFQIFATYAFHSPLYTISIRRYTRFSFATTHDFNSSLHTLSFVTTHEFKSCLHTIVIHHYTQFVTRHYVLQVFQGHMMTLNGCCSTFSTAIFFGSLRKKRRKVIRDHLKRCFAKNHWFFISIKN